MSQMNTQQQSCFSLLDLSPVPQFTFPNSCYPQPRVNNFLMNDRPSTLNQLPSQNNIGSAILDRTDDPKANIQAQINYNKSLTFSNYNHPFQNNDYNNSNHLFYNHNPETHDFLHQELEMNNLNHRLDSVNILEKKDSTVHNAVQPSEAFYTENEAHIKQNIVSTPPNNPSENLFGNIQIFQDINSYPQTLTPSQKNVTSQHSLQSNIPTPNIGQAISSVSDKILQNPMNDTTFQLFNPNMSHSLPNSYPIQFNQTVELQSPPVQQNQNGQYIVCGKYDNFQGISHSQNAMNQYGNLPKLQTQGKVNSINEKIKEQMKLRQDQQNSMNPKAQIMNNSNNVNMSNSYTYQNNMQQSTNSMNSQTSISSTSSINDHSQSTHNNNNNNINNSSNINQNTKMNYSYPFNNPNIAGANGNIHISNSGHSSIPISTSSHSGGGIYTANKLNIPLSMTSSVNNVIVEEQENDIGNEQKEKYFPQSNSEDEGNDNSNKQQQNINIKEYARKVDFCKCKKSKCLKLYCECFLRGNYCNEQCICTECGNNDKNLEEREKAIDEAKTRNSDAFNLKFQVTLNQTVTHKKGCHCKRTHCLKKYCECYNAGLKCTNNCKCDDCKNNVDNLKNLGGGGGAQGLNAIQKMDEDNYSAEINSQMIQSIDYQLQQGPIERKTSMCSSTGISGFQNRKRTRSEVLDQIQPKNDTQQQIPTNDAFEPEIRKKKNSLCIKHANSSNINNNNNNNNMSNNNINISFNNGSNNNNNSNLNNGITLTKMKSLYQPNQTSYNSFDQNFIYTTSHSQTKNSTINQPNQNLQKKIQS